MNKLFAVLLVLLAATLGVSQTQIDLTRQVKKVLPLANGGTNNNTWLASRCVQVSSDGLKLEAAAGACGSGGGSTHNLLDSGTHLDTITVSPVTGAIIFANSTPKWAPLAGSTSTIRKMLCQTGNGSVSAAPLWCQPSSTDLADFSATPPSTSGQIPIYDAVAGKYIPGDPLVQGLTAHDAVGTSTNPVAIGGFASAAAPSDVSADGDIVRAWFKRNGAQVVEVNGTTPVSAASLPLPTGAATEATLAGIKTGTDKIPASPATDRATAAAPSSARLSDGAGFYKATTPSDTQPVSAASLPLPSGAATDAVLTGGTQKTKIVDTGGANVASVSAGGAVKVDNSAVTQPVSGTVTTTPPALQAVVQGVNNKSTGSVASLTGVFSSNITAGNSIVVLCSVGNATAPTITDTIGNTYKSAAQIANSVAFNAAVFYTVNSAAGADTVTCNNGGTTASIALRAYEVSGIIQLAQVYVANAQDASGTNTHVGNTTAPVVTLSPTSSNEIAFVNFSIGTAAQTITVTSPYINDSGQQNPTTPAGLFSFVAASTFLTSTASSTPAATIGISEPWAVAAATFKPATVPDTTKRVDIASVLGTAPSSAGKLDTNLQQINGSTIGTAQAGVQKVGISGATGVSFETTNGVLDQNFKNIGNTAVATGNGVTGAGSLRVTVASDNTAFSVKQAGYGTVLSNQQGVTASAAALATNTVVRACVKAFVGNALNVYVGPSGVTTSTGLELAPGDSVCLPVTNTNLIFVIASSTGSSVSWIATN